MFKNKYYFQSNLDTFGGNSGSAVFDTATGVVEGMRGKNYIVKIKDITMDKRYIIHPVHLKKLK